MPGLSNTDRIKELLGNGLSNEIVASTVGVTPSFISQLMSDETFYNAVIEKRTQTLAAATNRDRRIDGIEDKLIDQLDEAVSGKLIYKPADILRTFAVINAARRRGVDAAGGAGTTINSVTVNLTLPKVTRKTFTLDGNAEVIEVGDKTMVTMPAAALLKNLAKGTGGEKFANLHDKLPDSAKGLVVQGSVEKVVTAITKASEQGNPDARPKNRSRQEADAHFLDTSTRSSEEQAARRHAKQAGISLSDL